jgi:uncharacterized protein involved in outer membrane biogenesis
MPEFPAAPRRHRVLIAIAALAAVPLAAIALLLLLFDPNVLKPQLEAALTQAAGRPVSIAGPVRLRPALVPKLALHDVTVANPPGFSRPAMLRVARAEIRIALLPLLSRRVEVRRLFLDGPDLLLERDAAGTPNWLAEAHPPAPGAAPAPTEPPAAAPMALRIGDAGLQGGRIGWRDARAGPPLVVEAVALRLRPDPAGPVALAGSARWGAVPLTLEGEVGAAGLGLRAEAGALASPLPVALRLGVGTAAATIRGALADPRALAGIDLAVTATLPDLAALLPGAPALRDLQAAARLVVAGPGLAAGGALHDLRLASQAGEVAAALAWTGAPRLRLEGSLTATRLDLDALAATPPPADAPPAAPAAAVPPAIPPATPPTAAPARLIPAWALPLLPPGLPALALRLEAAALRAGGRDWQAVTATLDLRDGVLRLAPATATLIGGGAVSLRLEAEMGATPPAVRLAVQAPALDLGALRAGDDGPAWATGVAALDAALQGRGDDLPALAATLQGHAALALPGGGLGRALLARLPPDLLRLLLPEGPADVPLRCAALRLDAAEPGQARLAVALLESAAGRLGADGGIDLRTEALAIRLLPDLRLGPVQLRAPVHLGGTLAQRRLAVAPEAALAGGLGALLSLQRTPDRTLQSLAEALGGGRAGPSLPGCAAALAVARGLAPPASPDRAAADPAASDPAAPGPPPAAAPTQAEQVARDLLRGLFGRGRERAP